MKVLLSWLREFAPFDGDPVALGNTMSGLGHGGRRSGAHRCQPRRHRRRPRARGAAASERRPHPTRRRRCRRRQRAADLLRRVQHGGRATSYRSPRWARRWPTACTIERRKLTGQWSNGMLCSPRELEMSDDADGIMILDPRFSTRRGPRRRAGCRARRALRPRPHRQPSRRAVGRGRGARSRGQARLAVRHCRIRRAGDGAGDRRAGDRDDPRRRRVRTLRRTDTRQRAHRAVAAAHRQSADAVRHASDQQRGRRVQLRDVGARSTEPHPATWPRSAGPGIRVRARPRRRAHRDPRRRRASN